MTGHKSGHLACGRNGDDELGSQISSTLHRTLRNCMQALIFLDVGDIDKTLVNVDSVERCSIINDLISFLDDHPHRLQRLDRVSSGGSFSAQHHGICSVENRSANVGHLSTCRARISLHRVQHLGCHNTWLALSVALLDHHLLCCKDLAEGNLHAEITTGNHDTIRCVENFVEMIHAFLTLNLADNQRPQGGRLTLSRLGQLGNAAIQVGLDAADVPSGSNERCRDKVSTDLTCPFQVPFVLLGQSR
mmetsp:Transcript_4005/g.11410  ORF Transcript_4005/g.11410 Transcript_4005/m.11410 type:complete len:247 (-) Transcript_4005:694-1434(-)